MLKWQIRNWIKSVFHKQFSKFTFNFLTEYYYIHDGEKKKKKTIATTAYYFMLFKLHGVILNTNFV